jgi:predicted amidohydrolase YtcJ
LILSNNNDANLYSFFLLSYNNVANLYSFFLLSYNNVANLYSFFLLSYNNDLNHYYKLSFALLFAPFSPRFSKLNTYISPKFIKKNIKSMRSLFLFLLLVATFFSCAPQKTAVDLIITNAKTYTVNDHFDMAEAIAIKAGKIVAVGKTADILSKYASNHVEDAQGKALYPGFIDAHTHFYRYGEGLQTCDLTGTKSWAEIIKRVKAFSSKNTEGPNTVHQTWLIGRGWDQNDWAVKEYPSKTQLDVLFPKRPVLLTRVDGHGAIANQAALDLAHIKPNQKIVGGEIETKNGVLTGVLVDNAVGLVKAIIPDANATQSRQALLDAQSNCFAVGLTTVVDCGLDFPIVEIIEKMNVSKELKMRIYVMLSDDSLNYAYLFKRGIIKTDQLNVRSFKLYADGALGSRGACLLHPYADRPNHYGFLLKNAAYYEAVTKQIYDKGFQACTHAIGDSANREILRIYAQVLKGKNDKRWRIEHAQVVNSQDFKHFGNYNIIPSVQPTHATSDMYWAKERLGNEAVKGAYAYKQLLQENGWIPLGTDFPVEDISPILTFHAAVARQDARDFPQQGFQMENVLSREETLRGMTIWAAKGNFEEHEKGSLEVGKFADFIILDQDLMTVPKEKILATNVLKTYVGGALVFEKK